MAIKVETMKEETKEISFPCLMKDTSSDLVVLFTSEGTGTVLAAGSGWRIGEVRDNWIEAYRLEYWKPSPPITLSNA